MTAWRVEAREWRRGRRDHQSVGLVEIVAPVGADGLLPCERGGGWCEEEAEGA